MDFNRTAMAIDADGSIVLVAGALNGRLKLRRYDRFGAKVCEPVVFGAAETHYDPEHAIVDSRGRVLVSGLLRPRLAPAARGDAFVLRTNANGVMDPVVGNRSIVFSASARDDSRACTLAEVAQMKPR